VTSPEYKSQPENLSFPDVSDQRKQVSFKDAVFLTTEFPGSAFDPRQPKNPLATGRLAFGFPIRRTAAKEFPTAAPFEVNMLILVIYKIPDCPGILSDGVRL